MSKENEQPVAFIYDDEKKILYNRDTKYSYIKYPCTFLLKQDDGKELILGKDFKVEKKLVEMKADHLPIGNTGTKDASHGSWPELIAVPIAQPVKESGNEAIEMLTWITENGWHNNKNNWWVKSVGYDRYIFKTSEELYNLFKQIKL